MRYAVLVLMTLLPGCGWVEGERRAAADAARTETLAEVEDILSGLGRTFEAATYRARFPLN